MCDFELLDSFRLKAGEVRPDPTYASLTVEDLVKKLKGGGSSDSDSKDEVCMPAASSDGYQAGADTDGDNRVVIEKVTFFYYIFNI